MNGGKIDKATRKERLGRLGAQLLARERRLLSGLRDVEQEGPCNVLDGADAMDAASEFAANDVRACLKELRAVELLDINDAFQKLFDGTYGVCEECGKRIPEARLRLIPAASLCVACKRHRERLTKSRVELPEWSGAQIMADSDKSEAFCGQARRRAWRIEGAQEAGCLVATVLARALGMTACKEKTTSEEVSDAAKATGKAVEDATKK
jgi:DnaK suppressor protein